ncbi:hypothetical protein ABT294_02570 [Nonomuraea sp. NPDC000554]|uniref:hypothetical protein n=1 Tax=Nonomuraea sp. NPDC000554 TaxID=3154259 RepID=UPI0033321041
MDEAQRLKVEVDTILDMGRRIADAPMKQLDRLNATVSAVELSSGSYGVFGILGGSLGQAHDEVKEAARHYLASRREHVAGIRRKAFDTANQYGEGDGDAARTAAATQSHA